MIQYEYHSEGTHGVRTTCKDIPGLRSTLFPQTTGLAATGNMTLIEEMAGVMGTEGRALNNIANGTTFDKGTGLDYWGPTTNIGCAPSLPPSRTTPFLPLAFLLLLLRSALAAPSPGGTRAGAASRSRSASAPSSTPTTSAPSSEESKAMGPS